MKTAELDKLLNAARVELERAEKERDRLSVSAAAAREEGPSW